MIKIIRFTNYSFLHFEGRRPWGSLGQRTLTSDQETHHPPGNVVLELRVEGAKAEERGAREMEVKEEWGTAGLERKPQSHCPELTGQGSTFYFLS